MSQNDINYKLIRSKRKTISIEIHQDLSVIVRAPLYSLKKDIDEFVDSKRDWIFKTLNKIENNKKENKSITHLSDDDIKELTKSAKLYIPKRVEYFSNIMNVSYNRITIRHQKTCWGSCSSKKNLNFNCLLMLTPESVRDYIVVHELCHIKEMNHSQKFWNEVQKVLPNYQKERRWLKENGSMIISAMEKGK